MAGKSGMTGGSFDVITKGQIDGIAKASFPVTETSFVTADFLRNNELFLRNVVPLTYFDDPRVGPASFLDEDIGGAGISG